MLLLLSPIRSVVAVSVEIDDSHSLEYTADEAEADPDCVAHRVEDELNDEDGMDPFLRFPIFGGRGYMCMYVWKRSGPCDSDDVSDYATYEDEDEDE